MIKKNGNLFDTTAPAIGHGVNLEGNMGGGIAVLFKEKYPNMYITYKDKCELNLIRPGAVMVWNGGDHYVYNMATQVKPGPNANLMLVRYSAFHAAIDAMERGFDRIALPMIGCGIGGLVWEDVEQELLNVEALTGVEFEIWKYDN